MNSSGKGPERLLAKWLSFFFIAAFLTVSLSCSSSEEKKTKHLTRAQEYEERQEYSKAVIEYKNVIQIDPQDAAAHHALGKIYLKLKKGQEAFRSFLRTTELDPDNLDAQVSLGNIYLLTKKTDEARKKAELILTEEPGRIDGLLLMAGVQIQEKKIQEAIKTLDKAVSLDPSEVKVRMARGRVFTVAKQYERPKPNTRNVWKSNLSRLHYGSSSHSCTLGWDALMMPRGSSRSSLLTLRQSTPPLIYLDAFMRASANGSKPKPPTKRR